LAASVFGEFSGRAEIEVVEASFQPALSAARAREQAGTVDAFVSAGSNAALLRDSVAAPVATIQVNGYDILLALMEARPHVLSRAQIEAKLYNWDAALDSNAIEVHVHRLRRKLGEHVVRTVRGVGYYVPAEAGA
jgi:DNA-binding response OmpR family regulator